MSAPAVPRSTHTDPASERFWTGATVITLVRTVAALVLCLYGVQQDSLAWLVAGLVVYWVGDVADGTYARVRNCETRIGGVVDMLCDRLNCAAFYVGLVALQPEMAWPVAIYLAEFLVIDLFLSLAFLAWPVRSPNYFYEVDERIWRWNWSKPAKATNSALFAVMLLVTGWWIVGMVVATALLVVKCVSLRWLLQIGIPVPAAAPDVPPSTSRPTSGAGAR